MNCSALFPTHHDWLELPKPWTQVKISPFNLSQLWHECVMGEEERMQYCWYCLHCLLHGQGDLESSLSKVLGLLVLLAVSCTPWRPSWKSTMGYGRILWETETITVGRPGLPSQLCHLLMGLLQHLPGLAEVWAAYTQLHPLVILLFCCSCCSTFSLWARMGPRTEQECY